MYVNIEVRSHNRCHSGKTINITYLECVFVALVIQHAVRMCRIILSSAYVRLYHIFPYYPINSTIVGGNKFLYTQCAC
jgi:hypothetical protein